MVAASDAVNNSARTRKRRSGEAKRPRMGEAKIPTSGGIDAQ